jgi:peptidoglycan hydrolase-like protein with peptidoglycan-binding domain
MPLSITTSNAGVTGPTLDSPATINTLAGSRGAPVPSGSTVVGITIPVIRSDQTGLQYHTRNSGTEFRFNTGTLALTLRQEIHLSNALSACAQAIWLHHEQKHVRDNNRLLGRMDAELRADAQFAAILVNPTVWRPRADFNATQATIQARVGDVFLRLTQAAATALDTRQEYANTDTQVRIRCGGAVASILREGMYGHGIDVLQAALNSHPPSVLPPLVVDGVFGAKTKARVIEFQRGNGLTPDGVVGPLTKAALGI